MFHFRTEHLRSIFGDVKMGRMKTCSKCGKTLPLTDFYKHPKTTDGFLGRCKECHKHDARLNRVQNLDRYHAYDRKRKSEPERLEQRRRNARRTTRLYPSKRKAHAILARAIKKGFLVRGVCEKCGSAKVDAHHGDYSKPLEVRWLCALHHHAAHRKYDYDEILREAARKQ